MGVSRATLWRHQKTEKGEKKTQSKRGPKGLSDEECQEVLDTMNSEEFVDLAPIQIYAKLLDESTYLCSISTMYRVLRANDQLHERRKQVCRKHYKKPELIATAPNQVWTWDITKLKGPVKLRYFYLYVVIDIFSRYVTGWMIACCERASLSEGFLRETCQKQKILPDQLTIHSDRGSPMKSKTVAQLLRDLEVSKSHSRPHVPNDNPYSESNFKSLKYYHEFPGSFEDKEHAENFCRNFFISYNEIHYHSRIGLLTPESVHYGYAQEVIKQRKKVLLQAYEKFPERFNKIPRPPKLPKAAWINPPANEEEYIKLLEEKGGLIA